MIDYPNCKINIGLKVCRRRPDGYHDLQTFFYPIAIHDILEIIPAGKSGEKTVLTVSGSLNTITGENICLRAFAALKTKFPELPAVQMHLHKLIPTGAGLGGGSADGTFTLMMLNRLFHLRLTEPDLISLSSDLGSDCPFFVLNRPAVAAGRGEDMNPVVVDLSGYKFLIINPGIEISTAEAFSWVKPDDALVDFQAAVSRPVEEWKDILVNDFEKPVFERYPEIQAIKERLYAKGAAYAALSGTGSTVFGLFSDKTFIDNDWPEEYYVKEVLP